jgi:ATP-binding cassette subfamily B multidrug efflux pump
MKYKTEYENCANDNENYVLDIFNNFDKIIFRGQAYNEIDLYKDHSAECIKKVRVFYQTIQLNAALMTVFIYIIILSSLYYLVILRKDNKLETKEFIALFTILLMYRDRFSSLINALPSIFDINGRFDYATEKLSDLQHEYSPDAIRTYNSHSLDFTNIEFSGVYYKYKTHDKYLFENLNISIKSNKNIVGITGLSGRGKSTLMKLLLRIYPCEKGLITIDGQDIQSIDPIYIRQNITYVGQSAKLFNKRIRDNLMYGCNRTRDCEKYMEMIMVYPKIKQLYANVDLLNGNSGSLGEALSGGQRQIINIISGLINPSPILVLDEPTNALDMELKTELLSIINSFRAYKKCIIIITHDRDVYPMFDQRIKL